MNTEFTQHSALSVHEPCDVGWCAATPPNEIVDAQGQPATDPGTLRQHDISAPAKRIFDDPEVCALREYLRAHNGLHGLEICEPTELQRITNIFRRDGFVVVRDLLNKDQLASTREGCTRILGEILDIPGHAGRKYLTESNRLPHRYSYGTASASRQLLHDPVWASMLDLPTTTPILTALFGCADYFLHGAGGDLCLPGAMEYQALHVDFVTPHELPAERIAAAERAGLELRSGRRQGELDPRTEQLARLYTPPRVTINFTMSDLTWENGPIRHIPGSHALPNNPPGLTAEPPWMRLATLVGAPAGAGIFRDSRAWHGATPNLSREVRALPNVEYSAPWISATEFQQTMPYAVWQGLSDHAKHISRRVVAPENQWPAGAGTMHPLAAERLNAKTRTDTSR